MHRKLRNVSASLAIKGEVKTCQMGLGGLLSSGTGGGLQETTEASANLKFHQQRKKLCWVEERSWQSYAWEMKLFILQLACRLVTNASSHLQRLRS